jgi:hypothetical protein
MKNKRLRFFEQAANRITVMHTVKLPIRYHGAVQPSQRNKTIIKITVVFPIAQSLRICPRVCLHQNAEWPAEKDNI